MKKIKKILAAVMTLAMVLGMSMTTFAAASTNIVVNNLDDAATITAVQVIGPNTSTETGWEFLNGAGEAYAQAFGKGSTEDDLQDIIWMLMWYEAGGTESNFGHPDDIDAPATANQIQAALDEVSGYTDNGVTGNQISVSAAGVYAIQATSNNPKYVYNKMAAYVSFDNYDTTTGIPANLKADPVYAKKTDVPVTKTVEDEDKATGISETVTYKVNTAIPYGLSEWKFTDTITNAEYVVVPAGEEHAGTVPVQVKIGTKSPETHYATVTELSDTQYEFELDLTSLLSTDSSSSDNGADVELSYQAVVKGLEVNNEIQYDPDHSSDEVKLYTGSIKFTKLGENSEKLANAEFKISRTLNGKTEYATFSGETPDYTLIGWVDKIDDATPVKTNTGGTLTVNGLDKGTYHFTEVKAPEGYSINEDGKDVTLTFAGQVAVAKFSVEDSMTDTELSALPSTGGIGTTIFTIGGCIIMIAAAGLFFASRRKSSK